MQQITSTGAFMSCVAYDPTKDRSSTSPFPAIAKKAGTHILVRGRRLEHIEDLRRVVPDIVIDDQPYADYRFRAVITRKLFKKYQNLMVDHITYGSHFKEVSRDMQLPQVRQQFYSAMVRMWNAFHDIQPRVSRPPVSGYRTSGYSDGQDFWGGDKDFLTTLDKATQSKVPNLPGPIDLAEMVRLLQVRKVSYASTTEMTRLDDDAFELLTRLQETHGTGKPITAEQINDVATDIETEREELAKTKELQDTMDGVNVDDVVDAIDEVLGAPDQEVDWADVRER